MSELKNITQFLSNTGKRNLALQVIDHFASRFENILQIKEISEAYFYSFEYEKSLEFLNLLLKQDLNYEQKNDVLANIANIYIITNKPKEAFDLLEKLPTNNEIIKLKSEAKKNIESYKFINPTGFWNPELEENHVYSQELAEWISQYLPKDKLIYDFGCGLGNYCKYLLDKGFQNLIGYEGKVADKKVFNNIIEQDLTKEFNIKPSNVICLEVGEHIPAEYQDVFLDNICCSCDDKLILSWAIKGQNGCGHVNCLNYEEIVPLIEKRNFKLLENETLSARRVIKTECDWFKNTLYIFQKKWL